MSSFTYQQARAEIARTVVRTLDRESMIAVLSMLAYSGPPATPRTTARQLAYRIAWCLLPAGVDQDAAHSYLSADLSVLRQRF
jgi:hypothetical protein